MIETSSIGRRGALALIVMAASGLAACGGEPPAPALSVTATGAEGMNPGPDGDDRPVVLTIVQLRGTAAFEAADAGALADPASSLGADFIRQDQLAVPPGGTASAEIAVDPGATAIGVVGGFRSLDGKVFKRLVPAPAGPQPLPITVSSAGISL